MARLQQIAHTVRFTKLANIITWKRLLITQSQKLVTANGRLQVRIVNFNVSDNCNIKQNTTLNMIRSQKHGLYYIIYHSSKFKDHKNNCSVSYTNPIQLKRSVKNLNFCIYFQCEKLTGNEIFLVQYI